MQSTLTSITLFQGRPGASGKLGDDRNAEFGSQGSSPTDIFALGRRERSMCAIRGLSRKAPAQPAGVSERYVASLESGLGLARAASTYCRAANLPLEDLVVDPISEPTDWPLLRELIRKSAPEVVENIEALLSGRFVELIREIESEREDYRRHAAEHAQRLHSR